MKTQAITNKAFSTVQKGFTLIELAVVIAIIAILAAVAIPRFADTTTSAEASILRDFKSQLVSGAAMYTARKGTSPTGLDVFMTNNPTITAAQDFTISAAPMVNKTTGNAACAAPAAGSVTCSLTRWRATYTYDAQSGIITGAATAVAPNTQAAFTF